MRRCSKHFIALFLFLCLAALPVSAAAVEAVVVTTGDASEVSAFSAVLSMTARGSAIYGKAGKVFGFQYCVGTEFSENEASEYTHTWGGDETTEDLPGGDGFSYTGLFPCLPGRTYFYRGYFAFIDESTGDPWPFYTGEVKSFTTPGTEELPVLEPGSSLDFTLVDGQSEIWSLAVEESGFYTLSVGSAQAERFLCAEGDKDWKSLYGDEPFYAQAGEPLYVRITARSYGENVVEGTVTAAPFDMKELWVGEALEVSAGNLGYDYIRFTPEDSGQYLLSLDVDGAENCSIFLWNAESGKWGPPVYSEIGAARMLIEGEAGVASYIQVSPGYQNTPAALRAEAYTPPEEGAAVSVGEVRYRSGDPLTAVFPVTVELPAGVNIWPKVECQMGGRRVIAGGSGHGEGTFRIWEATIEMAPVPGQEYRYRAYLELREEGTGKLLRTVYENGDSELWHTFRAPSRFPAQALRADEENAIEMAGGWGLLSFTPAESGIYTFTPTRDVSLKLWDSETARWQWWQGGEDAAQALLGGESLYIQASSNGGAVTLGRPSEPAAIRRGDGTIVAALNAEASGTYVFAAFGGQEGKLLDAGVKTGSGPLGAGLEADVAEPAVRAFRLDDGLRPLGDAVDFPV